MKNFKKNKGVAMLPLVLLIGGLITVIALTITLTSSLLNHSSAAVKWSSEALAGAQAGVDDGIMQIIRNNSHSGTSTLAIGNANVTVIVSSSIPVSGKDTITSCGVVRSSQKKLQAVVNIDAITGQVNIESIQEIAIGESCPSAPVIIATVPSAPQSLTATPGNTEVILNWSAPSSNGGSSITNYKVYRGTSSGNLTLLITLGNVLTYTNTGLTNGTPYYYKVSAVNAIGEGSQSNEANAIPATVPTITTNAATNVAATTATLNGSITSEGGASSTITGFDYGLTTSYGFQATSTYSGGVGNFSNGITGLTAETLYNFRAKAKNSAGWGYGSNTTLTTEASAPQTGYIDPDGVVGTPEWFVEPGESTNWEAIDDGVRQPTEPDISDYIYRNIDGVVDVFSMSNLTGVDVATNITVWAYIEQGGAWDIVVGASVGGAVQNYPFTSAAAWQSLSFDGNWTQAQLDAINISLSLVALDPEYGGGAYVYAMYGVVTYTQ